MNNATLEKLLDDSVEKKIVEKQNLWRILIQQRRLKYSETLSLKEHHA